MSRFLPHRFPSRTVVAAALAALTGAAAAQQATVDLAPTQQPSADDIRQGLFPDDECEQLKASGFKCMGFKPPVRFSLPAVAFKVGSAELPDGVRHQLDAFADALRGRSAVDRKVRIEGHADASGEPATNLELSQRRADAAKQYLVAKGVQPALLNAVGMGAREPKDSRNPTAPENRRVVIGRDGDGR